MLVESSIASLLETFPDLKEDSAFVIEAQKEIPLAPDTLTLEDALSTLREYETVTDDNFDVAVQALKAFLNHLDLELNQMTAAEVSERDLDTLQHFMKKALKAFDESGRRVCVLNDLSWRKSLRLFTQPKTTYLASQVKGKQGASLLTRAQDFLDCQNAAPDVTEIMRQQLLDLTEVYKSGLYYFPYTALVQSSGMGKSFHVSRLRRNSWLFYASIQPAGLRGFPVRSAIADFLLDPVTELRKDPRLADILDQSWQSLVYRSFFTAYLYEMEFWICSELQSVSTAQFTIAVLHKLQDKWGRRQLDPETHESFWKIILARTCRIVSSFCSEYLKGIDRYT
jgi:hypothetical protein